MLRFGPDSSSISKRPLSALTFQPFQRAPGVEEDEQTTEAHTKRMWAGQNNILVAVRVRPLLKHDRIHKGIIRVLDKKVSRQGVGVGQAAIRDKPEADTSSPLAI